MLFSALDLVKIPRLNQIPKTRVLSFSFKPSKFLIGSILFVFLAIALRIEILRGFGRFLICETALPNKLDAVFVLSGNSFDRANHTASLQKNHQFDRIVCTGGNQIPDMKSCCPTTYECDFTEIQLRKQGIRDSIQVIREGTSTKEESDILLAYCKKQGIDSVLVVSNLFHTRRIHQVFSDKFEEEKIRVFISGAPNSQYEETNWWNSENGLIALNNEYIKLLYYLFN